MDARKSRERQFHDHAFSEGVRAGVGKYYAITQSSRRRYRDQLLDRCRGMRVLEYGCGPGSAAFMLGRHGAHVTGIDISGVAVQQASAQAQREGLRDVDFRVMDAEALGFADDSFDRICGTGILHHLDLERAFCELARTLRPGGSAIFVEPLGHNPIINLYRKLTPKLRTVDEHPLSMRDLELADSYFGGVQAQFFHLQGMAAVPFRGLPGFDTLVGVLDAADRALFRLVPPARRLAWQVVLTFSNPRVRPRS